MATPLAEVQAAAVTSAGGNEVPEDVEKVRRPLPPVGHFGYTEEDADKVRKENEKLGATANVENTAAEAAAAEVEVEPSGRGAGISRSHTDSATRDGAVANVAGTGNKRGQARRAEREEAVQQAPNGQSRSGSQSDE